LTLPHHYLLVDDRPEDQLLAQEAFELLAPGGTLTCLSSGEEALRWLRSGKGGADVILLDVNMPGMSGFEVLCALKADPALACLPVVMLSTSGAYTDVQTAYTLHASSYLVKAQEFGQFLEQIDAFLAYWRNNRVIQARPPTS